MTMWRMTYGATPLAGGGARFRAWAPKPEQISLKLYREPPRLIPMQRAGEDFEVVIPDANPGDRYSFVLDATRERPDPVSRLQPEGVHGPSEIIDPDSFPWSDQDWTGVPLAGLIFYELHTGTFTPEGTFESIIPKLLHLIDLGITAIELMPLAAFPGSRNWGYDGVDLYAPHAAYGGPVGLKKLVDACHSAGLAVVLDVVYNHIGPEGNYLSEWGPYFTDRYRTPWGEAINYDGPGSDGVRRFIIDNALYWLTEYHIDALRLDAIHGIFDFSAYHVLAELRDRFHTIAAALGRQAWVIAESDLNDVRVIQPRARGGYGMDAQWLDEFHHSIHSVVTGATRGYLAGFGRLEHLRKALTDGFVYDGVYSAFRRRRFGSSSKDQPGDRFVAFNQNHDQIANTAGGRRLSRLVPLEQYKLVAALLFCSPYLPLLFMGEEFAETAPFLYFTSHTDPELAKAVTQGRLKEVADFALEEDFSDPQAPETFEKSKITWPLVNDPSHAAILRLYRDLTALRKATPALNNCRRDLMRVTINEDAGMLTLERSDPSGSRAALICNFKTVEQPIPSTISGAGWRTALLTASDKYAGPSHHNAPPPSLPGESALLFVSDFG
jgi:maltooligosyltrehalose trehalohydrolase